MLIIEWIVFGFLNMSIPKIFAEPEVLGNDPVSILMVVVFPAPLCPRRTKIWFLNKDKESSFTALKVLSFNLNCFVNFEILRVSAF